MDTKGQARVLRDLKKLQAQGNQLRSPHTDSLGDGLFELRTPYKGMIFRHLFCFHPSKKGHIIVLRSFEKKTQKTPQAHIDLARQRMGIIKAQQEIALGTVKLN
jgi:phage-related protein